MDNGPTETEKGKHRSWAYTVWDTSDENLERLRQVPCALHVCGREIAPSTNHEHFQGVISFTEPRHFGWWNQYGLQKFHSKKTIKSEAVNVAYCMKDGNVVIKFPEVTIDDWMITHEKAMKRKKNKTENTMAKTDIVHMINNGESQMQMWREHPEFMLFHWEKVENACRRLEYIGDRKRQKYNGQDEDFLFYKRHPVD